MEIFKYKITGISPLLQHSPASMKPTDVNMSAKKKYIPEEEAELGCYRNDKKEFVIPTICFRSALLSGAKGRKIGRSAARSVLAGCVFPIEEHCILLDQKSGKPIKGYRVHTCRAVINRAGIIRARPMFESWSCALALEIDTEMLPNVDIVTQVLNIAGKIIGIMDWRPEKLGVYGRFSAELVA